MISQNHQHLAILKYFNEIICILNQDLSKAMILCRIESTNWKEQLKYPDQIQRVITS